MIMSRFCYMTILLIIDGVCCYVLPSETKYAPPICTSYTSLCHLSYRHYNEDGVPIETFENPTPICSCSDNSTCAMDWDNKNNSVEKTLLGGAGMSIVIKMSYCSLPQAPRVCMFNEGSLVSRGRGPLSFELVGDISCSCDRPLHLHSSWTMGPYNYYEYSCGKPRCAIMGTKVCSVTKYIEDETYNKQYFCRCRSKDRETCFGALPSKNRTTTYQWCTDINTLHKL